MAGFGSSIMRRQKSDYYTNQDDCSIIQFDYGTKNEEESESALGCWGANHIEHPNRTF